MTKHEKAFAVITDSGIEAMFMSVKEANEAAKDFKASGVPVMVEPLWLDYDNSELDLFKANQTFG